MASLYAVIAEVLIRLLGAFFKRKETNREIKDNWHAFMDVWQKSKNNPVSHYEDGKDLEKQMDNDLN